MKHIALIVMLLLTVSLAHGQEVNRPFKSTVDTIAGVGQPSSAMISAAAPQPYQSDFRETLASDTLALPLFNSLGQPRRLIYGPLMWGGWYDWQLHRGLNVSLGASVFAQWGKGAWYKGAGFNQRISMMYAQPLSDRLTLAVGGYFSNTSWAHDAWRNAGVTALLGYRFSDRWEAYVYAQKSLVENRLMPLPLYDLNSLGDRIGAAVRYNVSPSFSVQVSLEKEFTPTWVAPFGPQERHDFNAIQKNTNAPVPPLPRKER